MLTLMNWLYASEAARCGLNIIHHQAPRLALVSLATAHAQCIHIHIHAVADRNDIDAFFGVVGGLRLSKVINHNIG